MSTSVNSMLVHIIVRRVWRYQKGHQKPEIKEEQTIQIYNDKKKKKRTKGQRMIYKTLHRKLKIEQH